MVACVAGKCAPQVSRPFGVEVPGAKTQLCSPEYSKSQQHQPSHFTTSGRLALPPISLASASLLLLLLSPKMSQQIIYSDKYSDDEFEYRYEQRVIWLGFDSILSAFRFLNSL
jgi:hypothetical protein